jgi:choline dehydrogenase-like flavoprotein
MPPTEDYDFLVLGSGLAGKILSWTLAAEGKRVSDLFATPLLVSAPKRSVSRR